MIKTKLYFLVILTFLFCGQGCGGDDNGNPTGPDEQVELAANPVTFEFDAAGGAAELQVQSNTVWRIEYDNSLWSRPNIQTAKGNATIEIAADENETIEARAMTLTLAAEGASDIKITVSQEAGEPEPEEPVKPDFIDPDNSDIRDLTSVELTQLMGVGWNLGNSLEAINVNGDVYTGNETAWGNPMVSKALIDAVKAAGFNTLRVPVSWSHMIDEEETYKISYEWKLRVEEVVNYALDNDMFVMINIHWDGGWMNHPDYENQEDINEKLAAFWKQIAIFFRDYDDRLLFAGTNEVHVEGDFGAPSAENAEVQNSFNQTFVNIVRATGGRNAYRHLVVQSYNTNIGHGVNYMTVPDDETEDRLMVEVHFYDPYEFALQEEGVALWGEENAGSDAHSGWGDEDWVDEAFDDVKTNFVDQGYGVILGEYGAILREDPDNTTFEDHVASRNNYLNYVTKAALDNGMVPVYWDNGHTENNGFGLFNRSTAAVAHADAVEAIVSALDE